MNVKVIVVLCLIACPAAYGQGPTPGPAPAPKPQPALQPPTPIWSQLLDCSAEWNTYYAVVPEPERKLFGTVVELLKVIRVQQQINAALSQQIAELDKRLKALEPKPAEPNAPSANKEMKP